MKITVLVYLFSNFQVSWVLVYDVMQFPVFIFKIVKPYGFMYDLPIDLFPLFLLYSFIITPVGNMNSSFDQAVWGTNLIHIVTTRSTGRHELATKCSVILLCICS